jgi:hypothetical protein
MTRSPALRPTRAPSNSADFCASLKRVAFTAAAGFAALFLITAIWIR